jgi:hypothetical protein
MNKKIFFMISMILLVGSLINLQEVSAVNVCCEKSLSEGWCVNTEDSACLSGYRQAPTSCEATSFCKLGTCINVQQGTCMENTPESVCNEANGVWSEEDSSEIAQCNLGCCLIGDQAAFVTQTRCKSLASSFGLETDFRLDINSEIMCIASAGSDEEGACVFESEYEKTCKRTTKTECQTFESVPQSAGIFGLFGSTPESIEDVTFYSGRLCSDTNLGTNCGPTEETTCVSGKDEVYYKDTCGNIANIYDADKVDSENYWAEIKSKVESCKSSSSNSNDKACGNCDYYLGSTCQEYNRNEGSAKPSIGENICLDLSCTYNKKTYEHGETWCADSRGIDENLPGSRSYRMVCYNGEVTTEPCADYRGEVCIESEINSFSTAACSANIWQDCIAQDNERDCLNIDRRDCQWLNSGTPKEDVDWEEFNDDMKKGSATNKPEEYYLYACVPKYSPGFNFWEVGDAENICALANYNGIVTYKEGFLGSLDAKMDDCDSETGNCFLITEQWINTKNDFCSALGDCGSKLNYLEFEGYHNESSYVRKGYESE